MLREIPFIVRKIDFMHRGEMFSLIQEKLVVSFEVEACFYTRIENEKQKIVAECCYNIYKNKECFLTYIEVMDSKYINKGFGTTLLKFVECDARRRGCTHVSGHYEPFDQFGDYAKGFYKRNQYEIRREQGDVFRRIYKDL